MGVLNCIIGMELVIVCFRDIVYIRKGCNCYNECRCAPHLLSFVNLLCTCPHMQPSEHGCNMTELIQGFLVAWNTFYTLVEKAFNATKDINFGKYLMLCELHQNMH